jgi:hypothetical protein
LRSIAADPKLSPTQALTQLPLLSLRHLPGLSSQSQPERRIFERQLVAESLAELGEPFSSLQLEWQPMGKPILTGPGSEGLDISLSYDGDDCLCSIGPAPQGCDLKSILHRSVPVWREMLSPAGHPAFDALSTEEPSDRRGARVWCARAAALEAGAPPEAELSVVEVEQDKVRFAVRWKGQRLLVQTAPVLLSRRPERMVALVLGVEGEADEPAVAPSEPPGLSAELDLCDMS